MRRRGLGRLFHFSSRSRGEVHDEIHEEFRFHLDMRTAELVGSGLGEEEARAQARREFGDQTSGARGCAQYDQRIERRRRLARWSRELLRDVAFGLRLLARNPGFSTIAVLTLAFGIGANAAIFSVFHEMLRRPLPVRAPGELVNLGAPGPKPGGDNCNQAGDCTQVFSYPMFQDLERIHPGLAGIAAHRAFNVNLASHGQTGNGFGAFVSGGYFPLLGLNPTIGRLIGPEDDDAGGAPVAVLSHEYWRQRFNEDPSVLNEPLTINGQAVTVVGVGPKGFTGTTLGLRPQVFVPISLADRLLPGTELDNRRRYWVYVFGRLSPGVSMAQARALVNEPYRRILAEVEAPLQTGMSADGLARFTAKSVTVADGARGQSQLHETVRTPLMLLVAVTAVVLLMACANVANLLLVRSAGRAGEMAVRLSIGASRGRLVGQLLTESCLLAAIGGLAGLLVARWTLAGITMLLPPEMTESVTFGLDRDVVLFAAGLALATGLLFGLVPALHATRRDLLSTLKDQSGQPSGARAAARFRTVLATVQIALAMALLASAGLFTRSLVNVSRVDLGLDAGHVVMFAVLPGLNGYTQERTEELYERLEVDLAAVPGVVSVSASSMPLLMGASSGGNVRVEGYEPGPDGNRNTRYDAVGPEFFRTMGMTLLAGRAFTDADTRDAPRVAIVNEAFARKFNLGGDVIGRRLAGRRPLTTDLPPAEDGLDTEIVGLVADSKYSSVKQDVPPLLFRPYRQDAVNGGMVFFARTALPPDELLPTIPRVVASLDATLPVMFLKTMPQQARENVYLDRLVSLLSAGFAVLATLLAAIGLYGVLACAITQRTREIGLRMALGADRARVRGMILAQVAKMTLAGGAAGLVAALALGMAARSVLFEVEGHDPLVLAVSAALLAAVALGAAFLPARRASRIEPMRALRWE